MDRLFLDANVLFSASYSPHAHDRALWNLPDTELVTPSYAVGEAARNLDTAPRRDRLEKLVRSVRIVPAPPHRELPVPLPEKDRPILLAAVAAASTHLLAQDLRHFGKHFGKTMEGVVVLRPDAYLRQRGRQP